MTMEEDIKKRYVRWQEYRINHFTFTNNIFLTFSVAAIGFWIKLITDKDFLLIDANKDYFGITLIFICISAAAGSCAVVTRLIDFRYTARLIIIEHKEENKTKKENIYRILIKEAGFWSWIFLLIQILSLAIGVAFFLKTILVAYAPRFL